MEFVVDFSLLYDIFGKPTIIKEVSVVSLYSNTIGHWLVRSPYPFMRLNLQVRRKNNKETLKTHYIHWNDRDILPSDLEAALISTLIDSTRIFVYGSEKVTISQKLLPNHNNIINLVDYKCPIIKIFPNLQLNCIHHGFKYYEKIHLLVR